MDIVSYSMEVINHPNYLIYEDGRVYNQKYNRFLKPIKCNSYLSYNLFNNNIKTCHKIHRLIGIHYIPNPDNKPCIDHIDRNRLNNDISNLRWVSYTENSNNKSKHTNNKSGHTNISYHITHSKWLWIKKLNGISKYKYFKSKIDAICYKFIMILRHKVKFT